MMAKTYAEYQARQGDRRWRISANRSRRMRGIEPMPVPPVLQPPKVCIAYDSEGNYQGRLQNADECPADCVICWEDAKY